MPRSTGSQPALGEQREQHRPVRVADLARRERARLDELVAGRQHADARPRIRTHLGARRGSRARRGARASSTVPGSNTTLAGLDVAARAAGRGRRARGRRRSTTPSSPSRVGALDHDDRVGAVGHRRAGHDADRLARRRPATVGACPAGSSPTTRSRTGASSPAPDGVGRAHRVAVHRGVRRTAGPAPARSTGSASTSPSASRSGDVDAAASGATAPRIAAWASASGITTRPCRAPARRRNVGELGAEVGAVERELDVGAQEVELLPDVVAAVGEHAAEHRLCVSSSSAIASVSCSSPPRPGSMRSSASKISGVNT